MSIAPQYNTGFETGLIAALGGTTAGTAPTLIAGAARNGNYGMRVAPAANAASNWLVNQSVAKMVARIAFRINTLPTAAAVQILQFNNSVAVPWTFLLYPSGQISEKASTEEHLGPVLSTGVWHILEFSADASIAGTWQQRWGVDGDFGAGGTNIAAGSAGVVGAITVGRIAASGSAFSVDFDDLVVGSFSGSAGSEYYGDGAGQAYPLVDGAHTFSGNSFSIGDAGTLVGPTTTNFNTAVDDVPFTTARSTTDNIACRVASAKTLKLVPTPLPSGTVANGVIAYLSYSSGATQSNSAFCSVKMSSGAEQNLGAGTSAAPIDWSDTTNTFVRIVLTPPGGSWTKTVFDGTEVWFGGGTDVSPAPTVQQFMLEVDIPTVVLPADLAINAATASANTFALVAAPVFIGATPLPEWDFETTISPWETAGGDPAGYTNGGATVTRVTTDSHSGTACMQVAENTAGAGAFEGAMSGAPGTYLPGTYRAGKNYELHFWAKLTAGPSTGLSARIISTTAGIGVLGFTPTSTWTEYVVPWTPTVDAANVYLEINGPGPNTGVTYLIDDITIIRPSGGELTASAIASATATVVYPVPAQLPLAADSAVASTGSLVFRPTITMQAASAVASTASLTFQPIMGLQAASAVATTASLKFQPILSLQSASAVATTTGTVFNRGPGVLNASSATTTTNPLIFQPKLDLQSTSASLSATALVVAPQLITGTTVSAAMSASAVLVVRPLLALSASSASASASLSLVKTTGPARVRLSSLISPELGTQTLTVRARAASGSGILRVKLYDSDGTTVRAGPTDFALTNSFQNFTLNPTGITNYSALDVEFEGRSPSGSALTTEVSWIEFRVPKPPPAGAVDLTLGPANGAASGSIVLSLPALLATFAPFAPQMAALAPVAWWRLGELSGSAAADQSGNGHVGTIHGGVTLATFGAIGGDSNTSATFGGASTDYIDVPHDAALPATGDMTVVAWVKPARTGNTQDVVAKLGGLPGGRQPGPFELGVFAGGNTPFVGFGDGASASDYVIGGDVNVGTGVWHMLVGRARGTELSLFMDGVLVQQQTTANLRGAGSTTNRLAIGTALYGSGADRPLQGDVDEPAVFNYALTDVQIRSLATQTVPLSSSGKARGHARLVSPYEHEVLVDGPQLYWVLDDEFGTARDASGHGREGVYTGALGSGYFLAEPGVPKIGDKAFREVQITGSGAVVSSYSPFVNGATQTFEFWSLRAGTGSGTVFAGGTDFNSPYLWWDGANNLGWYPADNNEIFWPVGPIANGEWTHFVLVFDEAANAADLYVNGVLIDPDPASIYTDPYHANPGNFILGRDPTFGAGQSATYAHFAIYDYALSPARIQAHYLAGTERLFLNPATAVASVGTLNFQPTITLQPANASASASASVISGATYLVLASADATASTGTLVFRPKLDLQAASAVASTGELIFQPKLTLQASAAASTGLLVFQPILRLQAATATASATASLYTVGDLVLSAANTTASTGTLVFAPILDLQAADAGIDADAEISRREPIPLQSASAALTTSLVLAPILRLSANAAASATAVVEVPVVVGEIGLAAATATASTGTLVFQPILGMVAAFATTNATVLLARAEPVVLTADSATATTGTLIFQPILDLDDAHATVSVTASVTRAEPLVLSASAVATTDSLTFVPSLGLQVASAHATGTLQLSAVVPLQAATAAASGSLALIAITVVQLVPSANTAKATASVTLLVRPLLTASANTATATGALTLVTPTVIFVSGSATASGSMLISTAELLFLATGHATASGSITFSPFAPVATVTIGPDNTRISTLVDPHTAVFQWVASLDFDEYRVKAVPFSSATHDLGITIPTTNGSVNMSSVAGSFPADTAIQSQITAEDLDAATDGDGTKIIKVFVRNSIGIWSA